MTREVLTGRDHAVILQPVDERDTHLCRKLRVLTVRASVDHRIRRIVIYVQNWRVRDVNSERAAFQRREAALFVSQRGVTRCADRHFWRKDNGSAEINRVRYEVSAPRPEA